MQLKYLGRTVCVGLMISAISLLSSVAHSATLISHSGANDPVDEGWNFSNNNDRLGTAAPVFGDGLSMRDAWSVDDDGSDSNVSYNHQFTAGDLVALAQPWRLSALVRVVDVPDAIDFGVAFQIEDGQTAWGVIFGSNPAGDTLSRTFSGLNLPTITNGSADYQLFEIVDDNPGDNMVDVYVNGGLVLPNYAGSASARELVAFGDTSFSAGSGGQSNYASVVLTAVPLPGGLVLFCSGLLCGFLRSVKTKRIPLPTTLVPKGTDLYDRPWF